MDSQGQDRLLTDLYGRFVEAYNAIDRHMRQELGITNKGDSFSYVLKKYRDKHRFFTQLKQLEVFAEVRNVTVHSISPSDPLFAPSVAAVEQIENLRQLITMPPRVIPQFQREVQCLSPNASIHMVLELIREKDFSQFPVYDGREFKGLLTENGITRWLAQHVSTVESIVEFRDEVVQTVLQKEERRDNWKFVDRRTPLDEIVRLFASKPELEAVLVTDDGKSNQTPIGIVTAYDTARLPEAIRFMEG